MTSSNGSIFRVTGPLCGELTGPGEFPTQRPVTRSFDVFFDLRLNKRLSKQPWGWWFETPPWSLWRQCNASNNYTLVTICRLRRWAPLTRIIVFWLMASSHYPKRDWLIVRKVRWYSLEDNFTGTAQKRSITQMHLKYTKLSGANEFRLTGNLGGEYGGKSHGVSPSLRNGSTHAGPNITHWDRDKIAAISQTFSNAFPLMKFFEFRSRFHRSLFLRFELTIFLYWFI